MCRLVHNGRGREMVVATFLFSRRGHPEPVPTGRELLRRPRIPSVGKLGCHPERSSAEKATKVCFGPLRL